ncbi:hypothetical protein A3A48_01580 [Candidatus Curtissbacteria bacterium RIFCSPLOWO2_01_FULL_37_9]|uniref:Uncharacterized protein n=1 Tax=Candidatus Curtissbacteria bacterium RIFCSPLOWO2_01_FULL_37_9 TaxID=1797724 RepID=A0A1F5GSY7_9BACT|nr:MAG: hypothetical protein A3A48_01580 [Candidatus Curtissbacteria bacterium RIFCSPLOWO2_01_FULL_37_9]
MSAEFADKRLSLTEQYVVFTDRDILILKGLVRGLTKKQFEDEFGIPYLVLKANKLSIAESFGGSIARNGIFMAIVEAFRQGKIDEDIPTRAPEKTNGQFSDFELGLWSFMYQGKSIAEICDNFNLQRGKIVGFEVQICQKLGVDTMYQAVAWLARENKQAGKL